MQEPETQLTFNSRNKFEPYPKHRVRAIIEDVLDAKHAYEALLTLGVPQENIEIFSGKTGSELLYQEEQLKDESLDLRKIHSFGDVEDEAFYLYQAALDNGRFVFSVLAATDEMKESVTKALEVNKAQYVNYFGSWTVEAL
jgi:hypothetical protein